MFLNCSEDSIVLVAPKRNRRFRSYLSDVQLLRRAGVAEPD
jgi:hypothetical protein